MLIFTKILDGQDLRFCDRCWHIIQKLQKGIIVPLNFILSHRVLFRLFAHDDFMKILTGILLLVAVNAFAQPADYWQQHVSYTISGTLIDSIHSFDGKLSVVYTNNSPDTLHEVWFHLYY